MLDHPHPHIVKTCFGYKTIKTCWFDSKKWFWENSFCTRCDGWENPLRSLNPYVDWLHYLIYPLAQSLVIID
jgi:hypothetical protein